MLEIIIYKNGSRIKSLGKFDPSDIDDVLNLMMKYPIEDSEGDELETVGVRFDVGLYPHIAVFVEPKEE